MKIADIIAYIAGIFLMLSFAPQVVKTIRIKRVDDISALLLILTLISAVLYEVYAFLLDLVPVLVMNGIFALLVVWELALVFKHRSRRAQ